MVFREDLGKELVKASGKRGWSQMEDVRLPFQETSCTYDRRNYDHFPIPCLVKLQLSIVLSLLISCKLFAQADGVVRVNQLGYVCDARKVAVALINGDMSTVRSFEVCNALTDAVAFRSTNLRRDAPYGKFRTTVRLDFSPLRSPGGYYVRIGAIRSPNFRIGDDVYAGSADFLLRYMREQRSGYNPFLRDSCHTHDGFVIYRPGHDSEYINVSGGWHDASDYLQYTTTSATATYQMLFAFLNHPRVFGDNFGRNGLPGPDGIPDILDEAAWGLQWLLKMNPHRGEMYNQIADDRDHRGFRLPTEDTVDYGHGKERPVYFCTGEPQGLFEYKNRSTGLASTAGKFASAFALGAKVFRSEDPDFAEVLEQHARWDYVSGEKSPGVCQTAPCRSPYFYEEENWADDMELAGVQMAITMHDTSYLRAARSYGEMEPVSPWMGADSARHYEWYPFINLGHFQLAEADPATRKQYLGFIREGIERVRARAMKNPFRIGVPFIWCSNNYVSSFLTATQLYRELSGDSTFLDVEAAARDWLFGCNPWGTSMIIGLPRGGVSPKDPHSAFSHVYGYHIDGGLVDGPVKAPIFNSLKGIQLSHPDAFAEFQADVVYHDDWGDYSTDEPTMDGTAGLTMALADLEDIGTAGLDRQKKTFNDGGITRFDQSKKVIYLAFSGHEFANGGETIARVLGDRGVRASFFFTGEFYRNQKNANVVQLLKKQGNYLGPHSDAHPLYAPWEDRDSTLVTEEAFVADLRRNYEAMQKYGIASSEATVFLPPYEWYNQTIVDWAKRLGLTLVNFTPGTITNADYTTPSMGSRYVPSDVIEERLLQYESSHKNGLNGCILLMHIGVDQERKDHLWDRLGDILTKLESRGYRFERLR